MLGLHPISSSPIASIGGPPPVDVDLGVSKFVLKHSFNANGLTVSLGTAKILLKTHRVNISTDIYIQKFKLELQSYAVPQFDRILPLNRIRLDHRTQKVSHDGISLINSLIKLKLHGAGTDPHSNIQAGIIPYGIDQQTDFPIQAGIRNVGIFPIQAGITSISMLPPTSPIAVHIGQGAVLFNWEAPIGCNVEYYEISGCSTYGGSYFILETNIADTKCIISGLPMGNSMFFRIKSVHASGLESSDAQVKLGLLQNSYVTMTVRSIAGSSIPEGSVFTSYDSSGAIISFSAQGHISI